MILEAQDRPGGRLRTDTLEGFQLERSLPFVLAESGSEPWQLDSDVLRPRHYANGALVWDGTELQKFDFQDFLSLFTSRALGLADKLKFWSWGQELRSISDSELSHRSDQSAEAHFRQLGFSDRFIFQVGGPFFQSLLLDPTLEFSSLKVDRLMAYLFRGALSRPANGLEAIPNSIASSIPVGALHCGVKVTGIVQESGKVIAIDTDALGRIPAEAVVLATSATHVGGTTHESRNAAELGAVLVHFDAPVRPVYGNYLLINGSGTGKIRCVSLTSNVSPDAAPEGRHLVTAVLYGDTQLDDVFLAKELLFELHAWFPKARAQSWKLLRVDRVRPAAIKQVPHQHHLSNRSPIGGLWQADETTHDGSFAGAVVSGRACANGIQESGERAAA